MSAIEPPVSVLMPVRDGAEFLTAAADSISGQTFTDFEVVVVDDGSEEETREALAEWAREDSRVRILRQEAAGIVAALERARATARGPFLARMDADDIAEANRLAAQLDLLNDRSDLAGCGCLVRYFPEAAVRDGARRYESWLNSVRTSEQISAAMFVECPLAHPTFFLRADMVEAVGGYADRPWPEDYDLILRMWQAGHEFAKVPEVLHQWRERPDRLSRTGQRYAPEAFLACKVHYLRETLLAGGRDGVVWGAGPVGKTLARTLLRAGTKIAAFVELDPRKIGQEIHGAPVLEPAAALRIRGPLHLAAVGQPGARERILGQLRDAGMRDSEDFVPVA